MGFGDGGPPDPEARLLSASCGGIRVMSVYVPNGRAVGHEQYTTSWPGWAGCASPGDDVPIRNRTWWCAATSTSRPRTETCTTRPSSRARTHVSPAEREALAAIEAWGLEDAFRRV